MKDIIINDNDKQRFDDRYVPDPMSGCWLWTGRTTKGGYGVIPKNKCTYLAHRVSVKLSGRDIAGKVVRHKCDNPGCVNPAHLLTGTHADNNQDKVDRGRQSKGECAKQSNLTEADVKHIRSVAVKGYGGNIRALAKQYNVSKESIRSIIKRKTWSHI